MIEQLSKDQLADISMVDLAYEFLKEQNESVSYKDIMAKVFDLKGFDEEDRKKYMAYLFTQLNTDGRFLCVGRGTWGLTDWYPVEQTTDTWISASIADDLEELTEEEELKPLEMGKPEESETGTELFTTFGEEPEHEAGLENDSDDEDED